jgi:hypothetical protein
MKKTKEQNGKLKIPLEYQVAVSSFLKVKPEPKKPKKNSSGT